MSCSVRSNLYNYAPDCNNPIPLGVTMNSARQLTIEACGPDTHSEIIEKAELLQDARRRHKAGQDKLKCTEGAEVAQREKDLAEAMLAANVVREQFSLNGAVYRVDLNCPDASVKMTYVGNEE